MSRQPGERYHLRPPVTEEIWQRVANADQMVLYSLLPYVKQEKEFPDRFHGYPILGWVGLSDQDTRASVYNALRAGSEAGTLGYRCWDPHHGVRFTHGDRILDFIICFTCECMQVYIDPRSDEFEWADISDGPEVTLDGLLTEAGVYLAPREGR